MTEFPGCSHWNIIGKWSEFHLLERKEEKHHSTAIISWQLIMRHAEKVFSHLIFTVIFWRWPSYDPHCTEVETEAQSS